MSFPPPPGLAHQTSRPTSAQAQHHSSLPPRPPAASSSFHHAAAPGATNNNNAPGSGRASPATGQKQAYSAATTFAPRAVAANQPLRSNSPAVSASSTPAGAGYSSATTPTAQASYGAYQYPPQHTQHYAAQYQQPPQYNQNYYNQQNAAGAAPHIRNPFPAPRQDTHTNFNHAGGGGAGRGRHGDHGLDPETEAQIAQWQSAYMSKEAEPTAPDPTTGKTGPAGRREGPQSATGANVGPLGTGVSSAAATPPPGAQQAAGTAGRPNDPATSGKTVVRSGGGQTWTDSTLLEWDPAHFRLFAGNLAGEVTDDSLLKAFAKYPSVQKARVIRDKRTEKSKGYGFVSFSDGDDYFRAAREMQGKYIGSHPVLLRRAMTEIRPVAVKGANKGGKKGGGGHGAANGGSAGGGAGGGKGAKGGAGAGGGAGSRTAEGGVQKKQGKTKGGLRVLG